MAIKTVSPERILSLNLPAEVVRNLQNPRGDVAKIQAQATIDQIMGDRSHSYNNPSHGRKHREAVAAVAALHEISTPQEGPVTEVTGMLRR